MVIQIITAPYDSGVRDVGKGLGPARLLEAGLVDRVHELGHEALLSHVEAPTARVPSEVSTAFGGFREIAREVGGAAEAGRLPLLLTGSCYNSVGVVAGLATSRVGVIWLDTHTDINTPESTESGFIDGMGAAMLTGRCFTRMSAGLESFRAVADEHLVFVGVRDLDPQERDLLNDSDITVVPPGALASRLGPALEALRERVDRVYIHLDLDVLDPRYGRANELAAPDGLSPEEVVGVVEAIRDGFGVAAMTLSAYDPSFDPEGRLCDVAFGALAAALG